MSEDEKLNGRKPKGAAKRMVFTEKNVRSLRARRKTYMILGWWLWPWFRRCLPGTWHLGDVNGG